MMVIDNITYIHLYANKWIRDTPDEIMKLQPPSNISEKEWYEIYFFDDPCRIDLLT